MSKLYLEVFQCLLLMLRFTVQMSVLISVLLVFMDLYMSQTRRSHGICYDSLE